jgi:hypothetical protein
VTAAKRSVSHANGDAYEGNHYQDLFMRDFGCSEQSSKLFAEKMGRQDIPVCVVSLSKL